MDMINVIRSVGNNLQPFLAPVAAPITNLFTFQNKVPYWFNVTVEPGWYIFKPLDMFNAEVEREATKVEIRQYCESLPSFKVITTFDNVVVPFDLSDASQRGFSPKPTTLSLGKKYEPFTVVSAAIMADVLLAYKVVSVGTVFTELARNHLEQNTKSPVLPPSFSMAYSIMYNRQQEELNRLAYQSEEGRIRQQLEFVGAKLVAYNKVGRGIDVTYTHEGATFTHRIKPNLQADSVGICLSGRDKDFNLAATVLVMKEARKAHRPGIESKYYL